MPLGVTASTSPVAAIRVRRGQTWIALALSLLAAGLSLAGGARLGPRLVHPKADSVWFEADTPGYYRMMLDRDADHRDTRTHPLYSIATWLPTSALEACGLARWTATQATLALAAAAWIAALFLALSRWGLATGDAALFSLLALASTTSRLYLGVPETYLYGGVAILLFLAVAFREPRSGECAFAITSAGTIAFTITNWMVGLLGTAIRLPLRRAALVALVAFGLVAGVWGVEKLLFPSAAFFVSDYHESEYIFDAVAGGSWPITRAFFVHSMVAPAVGTTDRYPWSHLTLTFQYSQIGSAGALALVATLAWVALLAAGLASIRRAGPSERARATLVAALVAQYLFHLVFGDETVLYAPHYLPLLVIAAATATLGRFRVAARILAIVLLVSAAISNEGVLREAGARFDAFATTTLRGASPDTMPLFGRHPHRAPKRAIETAPPVPGSAPPN